MATAEEDAEEEKRVKADGVEDVVNLDTPGFSRITFLPRQTVAKSRATVTTSHTPQPTFSSLGITQLLLDALGKMAVRLPTEIQAACIPPLLEGKYTIPYDICTSHY